MKANIILIFSCLFVLFLATAAQASEFTDNTCYEEGANCQSEAEWKYGWCEAAVAAGAFQGTAEQCVQPGGGGGRLVGSTQSQNAQSSASSSGHSGGGQGQGANQIKNPNNSEPSSGGTLGQGSDQGDTNYEKCKSWRVPESNPSAQPECVRPSGRPIGALPHQTSPVTKPEISAIP